MITVSSVRLKSLKLQDQVKLLVQGSAKIDGTSGFIHPQKGVNPLVDRDLTTKEYVDTMILNNIIAYSGSLDGGIATSTYTLNIDGGVSNSTYGGTSPINGGTA